MPIALAAPRAACGCSGGRSASTRRALALDGLADQPLVGAAGLEQRRSRARARAFARPRVVPAYAAAMAPLRALYVDLDNTLLGAGRVLAPRRRGQAVTLLGLRAIEACHRADVEVVVMSGRRRAQVAEDARLLGGRAYIFEVGRGGGRSTARSEWLTGDLRARRGPARSTSRSSDAARPALLLERYAGRLEYHDPWHRDREVSHLFRGAIDALRGRRAARGARPRRTCACVDNGACIDARRAGAAGRAYHLRPEGRRRRAARVARHMRVRGYAPEECIAVGDSREDLSGRRRTSGRSGSSPTRSSATRLLAEAIARRATCASPRPAHGPGVYEAVVTSSPSGA